HGGLVDDADAAELRGVAVEVDDDAGDVLEVGVRVDAARHGQADEVEVGQGFHPRAAGVGAAEHHATDLDGADAAFQIEGDREGLGGVELRGQVRSERAPVDVDGVAPNRLDDRDARRGERL